MASKAQDMNTKGGAALPVAPGEKVRRVAIKLCGRKGEKELGSDLSILGGAVRDVAKFAFKNPGKTAGGAALVIKLLCPIAIGTLASCDSDGTGNLYSDANTDAVADVTEESEQAICQQGGERVVVGTVFKISPNISLKVYDINTDAKTISVEGVDPATGELLGDESYWTLNDLEAGDWMFFGDGSWAYVEACEVGVDPDGNPYAAISILTNAGLNKFCPPDVVGSSIETFAMDALMTETLQWNVSMTADVDVEGVCTGLSEPTDIVCAMDFNGLQDGKVAWDSENPVKVKVGLDTYYVVEVDKGAEGEAPELVVSSKAAKNQPLDVGTTWDPGNGYSITYDGSDEDGMHFTITPPPGEGVPITINGDEILVGNMLISATQDGDMANVIVWMSTKVLKDGDQVTIADEGAVLEVEVELPDGSTETRTVDLGGKTFDLALLKATDGSVLGTFVWPAGTETTPDE